MNREKNNTNNKLVLEYNAFKNLGFGIGLDRFNMRIEAEGEDYPGVNFNGKFSYQYFGGMLYAKMYF